MVVGDLADGFVKQAVGLFDSPATECVFCADMYCTVGVWSGE